MSFSNNPAAQAMSFPIIAPSLPAPDPFFDINGKFPEVFNNGDNLYVHHN